MMLVKISTIDANMSQPEPRSAMTCPPLTSPAVAAATVREQYGIPSAGLVRPMRRHETQQRYRTR
jgi:hypothetical protein